MKKGISLIVVLITVIIMIILMGVIVINSGGTIVGIEKNKLQMDIAQLETLMNTYKIRKNGNIDFETVDFSTASLDSEHLEQFQGETIVNNIIELYIIDLSEIDAEQVNYGDLSGGYTDRYLYSLDTGKVYYEKGIQVDNITYYYVENGEG